MKEEKLIAEATTKALLDTVVAEGVNIPSRLLRAISELEKATEQKVIKVTAGKTTTTYEPDGPFPPGTEDEQWMWQSLRLSGDLFTMKKYRDWPKVREVPPQPCYVLHLSENGITAEGWLREQGFKASSSAPFRCTLQEFK